MALYSPADSADCAPEDVLRFLRFVRCAHLVKKPAAVTPKQVGSKTVVLKYTNTSDWPHLLPRTNGKKKVFEFLYKHSSTAITNSQRVKVVPAPYGVRQPVASYRPLARTTRNLTASTALCRYSLVPPTTLSPLLVARSTMQMATNADLRCHSVASFATYQSAASPLRLSRAIRPTTGVAASKASPMELMTGRGDDGGGEEAAREGGASS